MSLAALTVNNRCPILLSDVLITANDNTKDVEIPVFLSTMPSLFTESKLYPDSLKQKSFIINDQLAICMARYVSEMKDLLTDLRQFFKFYPVDLVHFQKFLDSFDKAAFARSSCCFLLSYIKDEKPTLHVRIIGEWKKGNSPVFGDIFAAGTGRERILEEMGSVDKCYTYNQHVSPFKHAVATHCIMICKLIGSEFFSASTIKDFWGAAFELIGFDGHKFIKVDDIGFLIWDWIYEENGNFKSSPRLAVDYKYYNGILVLTINNFVTLKRYGIIGLDQSIQEIDTSEVPKEYRFSSKKVSCCYRVQFPNGNFKISSFFYEKIDETAEDLISVTILPSGHSQVAIQMDFENQMMADIKRDFSNGAF